MSTAVQLLNLLFNTLWGRIGYYPYFTLEGLQQLRDQVEHSQLGDVPAMAGYW